MSDDNGHTEGESLPKPVVTKRRRWSVSLIWLVPLAAAVVGATMLVNSFIAAGPSVTVSFQTAEGIEANKTQVKYKNVVIGKVSQIDLSDDRAKVLVTLDLEKKYSSFATAGSRFWVVRPRIGLGGVSGLGTLFSGAYIGADTGDSKEDKYHFEGLETPPPLTNGEPGSSFTLKSDDLGSLDIGSPVYFRRIQVGRVVAYKLDDDGKGVSLQVFVEAPKDKFVTHDTHFWNASGLDVSVDAGGFKLNTESLATVVAGGVAFQTPPDAENVNPAQQGERFQLYADEDKAMHPADGPPVVVHMRFKQSVRGLSIGAPLDFQGITLGSVKKISVDFDPETKRFPVDVTAVIYPERLGKAHEHFVERSGGKYSGNPGALLAILVKHSLRAQMRNGNLLTGQLYIALDFFPKEKEIDMDPMQKLLQIPTVPGSFDKVQEQVASIVDKLDKVPFDQIGINLNTSIQDLDKLLKQFHGDITPEIKRTLEDVRKTLASVSGAVSGDSPLQQNLGQTLHELQRAARSLRVLTDYLGRHPESLIRGKRNDTPSPVAPPPAAPPSQGGRP